MPKSLTLKETASLLEITPATVLNWEKQGYIKSSKLNNKLTYEHAQVLDLKSRIDKGEIDRLTSRANKKNSEKKFLPDEYFDDPKEIPLFNSIVEFILSHGLKTEESVFVLSLNKLVKEKFLENLPLEELLKFYKKSTLNNNLREELNKWQLELDFSEKMKEYDELLHQKLPGNGDILGAIYQSIISEGHKSKEGSYYTPKYIAEEIVQNHIQKIKGEAKVLDPCCGTGQFLLAAGEAMKKQGRLIRPHNIWGYDIDRLAVQIARINLMIKFRDFDFNPNIYCKNVIYNYSYDDKSKRFKNFDLIIGNPPWGAEFKIEQTTFLKEKFPEILSFESYSYFVLIALNMLRSGGYLSFILPESILNIKVHKDIRSYILQHTQIQMIKDYGRVFKNVFTPVVRLDLQKTSPSYKKFPVELLNVSYQVHPKRFLKNVERVFDIYLTDKDEQIINKMYQSPFTTLKNQADWALGIVTGNNGKYLSDTRKKGYENIIKGTDIVKYGVLKGNKYILFEPKHFQQVAPVNKYRAREKLIYRFISKKLVFAYDNKKSLTLNSANILIPKIPEYPVKVIMALLNSSIYQFIFKKKFFTHKVLRGHLEQLPLPIFDNKTKDHIENLANKLMLAVADEEFFKERFNELDDYIYKLFNISPEEKNVIRETIA